MCNSENPSLLCHKRKYLRRVQIVQIIYVMR